MKRISVVLLALILTAGFGISKACAEMYVSGNAGAVFVEDSDLDDGFDTGELSFDTGFGLTGALGHAYGNGVRAELELGYRNNDLDELEVDGFGSASVDGDVSTVSLMANAYYDFAPKAAISPFVGAGIGFANIDLDFDDFGSEDDTVFAYQLAVGGSLAAGNGLNVDLQYRYFATSDPDFDGLEAEYATHNVMIGLRKSF